MSRTFNTMPSAIQRKNNHPEVYDIQDTDDLEQAPVLKGREARQAIDAMYQGDENYVVAEDVENESSQSKRSQRRAHRLAMRAKRRQEREKLHDMQKDITAQS